LLDVAIKIRDEALTPTPWPEDTPEMLVDMCKSMCWRKDPSKRSSIKEIVEYLNLKFPDDASEESSNDE
jgi:hypothetical protein